MIALLSRIIKGVSLATVANLAGRAANVLIPLTVITLCGVNGQTDRFFFILALGFFCYGNLANAISETTVPLLLSDRLTLTARNIVIMALLWFLLILAAGFIWTAYSASAAWAYALALALMAGAGLVNGFAVGALFAQERYVLPGLSWALRLVPLVIFMSSRTPAYKLPLLALGIGGADCVRSALLMGISGIKVDRPRKASARHPLTACFSAYSAVILAMLIMGLNPIVDRLIAGMGGPGAISMLETGERVYGVLAGISTTGLMTVLLTRLSKDAVQGVLGRQWPSVTKLIGVWSALWLAIGAACGYFALGWWLQAFTTLSPIQSHTVEMVYWLYLIGLPSFILSLTYVKHLQAMQRLWILVMIASLAVLANILLSLTLRHILGIPGIALATTFVYTLTCAVLMLATHGRGRRKAIHDPARS